MPLGSPQVTQYTVGWISALPIELAAAKAMLDEEHAKPPYNHHDPNQYTFGRIGQHNVVLTCLPAGQIGTNEAAVTATRMMNSFPSIRFGLMVGVGGGVPSAEADVRLGDIVISQPLGQHGGVVQYDFGKTGRDGVMTRTGFLNTPPKVLLNGVSQLRANHYLQKSGFAAHLAAFDQVFSRENAGPDLLYKADYYHNGGTSCDGCSSEKIVHREPRTAQETVRIHYGTIASGNQVIKDGPTRDRLSADLGGVLCFEMEAAGLMNNFPCLVVRGICDYADSHKNKAWQPYAAATAAACAKEILSLIPAAELAKTEMAGNVCQHRVPLSLKGVPVVGHFVPREAEMRELEQRLLPDASSSVLRRRNVVVAHGFGGIGKTQLAVDFARSHQHRFSSIFWLDGSSEALLKQSFVEAMARLPQGELTEEGVEALREGQPDAHVAVRECLQWLSLPSNPNWLLVFDSVDRDCHDKDDAQAYDVKDYFPELDHGSVLITSRLASLSRHGLGVPVGTVAAAAALAILESNAGKTIENAEAVLERLDGLPLALTQAGTYLRETNMSAATYIKHYDATWKQTMQKQSRFELEGYGERNVLTTWTMSYEQVRRQSSAAACLLKLWGLLDCGEMWYEFIASARGFRFDDHLWNITMAPAWLDKLAGDELEFAEAMGLLVRYSFARAREGASSHSMHPVVHKWSGQLAEGVELHRLLSLAGGLVALNWTGGWKTRKRVFAHGQKIAKWIKLAVAATAEDEWVRGGYQQELVQSWVLHRVANAISQDDPTTAEVFFQTAIQKEAELWGSTDSPFAMIIASDLGLHYQRQGRMDEAEALYQRSLQLGDHPSTLNITHNLGTVYGYHNRVDEAEALFQQALQGKEKALGPDHLSTRMSAQCLGVHYASLGRMKEAEAMYQRTLQGYGKVGGPAAEPFILSTLSNLGDLYKDMGKRDDAEAMYQQALQGIEDQHGPEEIATLRAVRTLGSFYFGDPSTIHKAEAMLQRALEGFRKVVGPEHTLFLATVGNLAFLYTKLGRTDEAEAMYQQALQGCEKTCEPQHRVVLNIYGDLGAHYAHHPSTMHKAEAMFQRALLGYEKVLGPQKGYGPQKGLHPDHKILVQIIRHLGHLYTDLGRLNEAEAMYQRALQEYKTAIKPEHLSTYTPALETMWPLADLYYLRNQVEDATAWYSKVFSGYRTVLGSGHPNCKALRGRLAELGAEDVVMEEAKSAPKRHMLLRKLRLKNK